MYLSKSNLLLLFIFFVAHINLTTLLLYSVTESYYDVVMQYTVSAFPPPLSSSHSSLVCYFLFIIPGAFIDVINHSTLHFSMKTSQECTVFLCLNLLLQYMTKVDR
jgi:hypothetical protein